MTITRTIWLTGALAILVLSGCVVRHHGPRHHRRHHRPHGGGVVVEHRTPPPEEHAPPPREPGDRTPPPPPREHDRTPPPPPRPEVVINLSTGSARRGAEVQLQVEPFRPGYIVYFNGRPLPKKTQGDMFVVTIPANAHSGHFEVEWAGKRYRSPHLNVTP
jgi:hypothetical protein